MVAVDGPGGSGKSTVSRALARRLGWSHLDTGAFYRAATLAVLRAGVDPDHEEAVVDQLRRHRFDQAEGRIQLDGEDVSEAIRGPEVTAVVSRVSAHPAVRHHMVEAQRRWVEQHPEGAVVEGRDIGTVVFPEALLKVYLDAEPMERARRRAAEIGVDLERVAAELVHRDRQDSVREASPLRPADDAIRIDTTGMQVEEVVEMVAGLVAEALGEAVGDA